MTPHLVSLASRLEGKPFHLVASHCQKNSKEEVVAYIKSKGLAADTPNVTVTSFGRHPQIKGNGYVPYYAVFDHTGKMAHHHMCGNYHGGDGLAMIEWVDKLLADAPEIWLGEEPFETHEDLAGRIAAKKDLSKAILELEALETADAEAERITAALVRYRDRALANVDGLLSRTPSKVKDALNALRAEFGTSALGEPVAEKATQVTTGDDLKRAIAIEKKLAKINKSIEKIKPCKPCKRKGHRSANLNCGDCNEAGAKTLRSARKKLGELSTDSEGLPIQKSVSARLADLE